MLISIIFGGMYVRSLAETSPLPLDMVCIFLVGSNILLSILVEQWIVILEISQEKMSACPSTPWSFYHTGPQADCGSDHELLIAKFRHEESRENHQTIQMWPKSNPLWLYSESDK